MADNGSFQENGDSDAQETKEWLDSLGGVLLTQGPDRVRYLLHKLKAKAARNRRQIDNRWIAAFCQVPYGGAHTVELPGDVYG